MDNNQTETAGNLSKPTGYAGIRPLGERILVEQKAWQQQLASGLYIPQGSREGHDDVGVIRAIGPSVDVELLNIKVGDRVMFRRRAGSAILPDPREASAEEREVYRNLLLLKPEDIQAVVED